MSTASIWDPTVPVVSAAVYADFASTAPGLGDALIGVKLEGTGTSARTQHAKNQEAVNFFDFLTPVEIADVQARTLIYDLTAKLHTAQLNYGHIHLSEGSYSLNNFRPLSGLKITTDGRGDTLNGGRKVGVYIHQRSTGNPAINVLSSIDQYTDKNGILQYYGQLSNLSLTGFTLVGKTAATVAAFIVAGSGVFAVWKSQFDFVGSNTFRVLEVQSASANNVFMCDFKVVSQDHTGTAVLINGGTYNTFDLFLTNCMNGKSLNFVGQGCIFKRCVSDGQQYYGGNQTVIINPTVEEWPGTSITADANPSAIVSQGFNETFINPMVILTAASAGKVLYALEPFDGTTYINPKLLVGVAGVANPIHASNAFKFTLVGPGQNTATNKMNTVFLDTNNTVQNLRRVSFVGDCSQFVTSNRPSGGKAIQYATPVAAATVQVLNNTDVLALEPAGLLATLTIATPNIPSDGQVLSVSSTQTVTAITITSPTVGANISQVPTTITATTPFQIVYRATGNKWYRC